MKSMMLSRRAAISVLPIALAGCAMRNESLPAEPVRKGALVPPQLEAVYGALPAERFPVPAVDFDEIDPAVLRRVVDNRTGEAPGTIVIETAKRALFLVLDDGKALRYGVGVGREGLAWSGRAIIGRKAEWPRWTPTAAMIAREPERNARWAGGMEPGLGNPLGARALYLYRDGVDTLYRIHGTNEPGSIGQSVSSGCIRLINQDIIDLHLRVPIGAPVFVRR
jgi:lipoprotein-anchoring transpeptidase ErfK/SrfK